MSTLAQRLQEVLGLRTDDIWGTRTKAALLLEETLCNQRMQQRVAAGLPAALNPDGTSPEPVHPPSFITGIFDIFHANSFPVELLERQGYFVLFHKVSQGTGFRDPQWLARRQLAESRGWLVGGYHFSTAGNVKQQVDNFLVAGQFTEKNAIVLDWEESGDGNMQLEQAEEWCALVTAELGRRPMIYGGRGLMVESIGSGQSPVLAKSKLWYVDLRSKGPGHMPTDIPLQVWPEGCTFHQYAGDGLGVNFLPKTIPGCESGLDLDRFFGTAEELRAQWPFTPPV